MELNHFLNLIKKRKTTIVSLVVLFLLIGAGLTVIQPFRYGAESKILILQNNTAGLDPYVISKSNSYFSEVLANVVTSGSFFSEVLNSGFHIDKDYFSGREEKRLKKWSKTIEARALNDTGIIAIKIYHKDKYQTGQIAEAVNYVLKTKNSSYYGGGDNLNIKVIDQPLASRWIVKPNIVLNLSLALALGLIFSLSYIYFFPAEKYEIRLWKKKETENMVKVNSESEQLAVLPQSVSENEAYSPILSEIISTPIAEAISSVEPEQEEISNSFNDDLASEDRLTYDDIIKRGDINNIL